MMYENMVRELRNAADEWRANHLSVPTFETRYDLALLDAADAIEDLIAALTASNEVIAKSKPRWIPVTEALPEQGKRYLVIRFDEVTKTQFIDILWHDAHDLWWNGLYKGQYAVTHWMPLPEPPKEDSK